MMPLGILVVEKPTENFSVGDFYAFINAVNTPDGSFYELESGGLIDGNCVRVTRLVIARQRK